MTTKQLAIKLNPTDDEGVFARDSWYGFGPLKASIGDDESLTIDIPGHETQIVGQRENDYGTYHMFKICGGLGFARIVDHQKYGLYLSLKLNNEVELPAEVMEKVNKGAPTKKAPVKKTSVKKAKKWS